LKFQTIASTLVDGQAPDCTAQNSEIVSWEESWDQKELEKLVADEPACAKNC